MAFTVTPASPRATVDFAKIAVSGALNDRPPDGTGGEFRYRIDAVGPSGQVLTSHEFAPSPDGDHEWFNVAFDEDGSWTLNLVDTSDESVEDTDSLTVAAAS